MFGMFYPPLPVGVMYSVALAAVVLFYVYYTGEEAGQCKLHEFFISFNMVRGEATRPDRQTADGLFQQASH